VWCAQHHFWHDRCGDELTEDGWALDKRLTARPPGLALMQLAHSSHPSVRRGSDHLRHGIRALA
jgi:hypothetical protein